MKLHRLFRLQAATCAWLLALVAVAGAHAQSTPDGAAHGPITLVIASHPYPERSIVNKALQQVVENRDGIRYRNFETLYGNNTSAIDVEAERKAYDGVDKVVYLFPVHWFNLTPMLKAYFNAVWFQWAPQALKGKKMLVVVTAGGPEKFYSRDGDIGLTMDEILTPMKACARYVGMTYLEPLAFYEVTGASQERIEGFQQQLIARLQERTPQSRPVAAKQPGDNRRVLVNIALRPKNIPDFEALLVREKSVAGGWQQRGLLEHLFNRTDKDGVTLVLRGVDEAQAKELIATLPLARYFDQVDYVPYTKQY